MHCALWKPRNRLHSLVGTALASLSPSDSPKGLGWEGQSNVKGCKTPGKDGVDYFPSRTGNDKRPFSAIQLVADHLTTHERSMTTQ